MILNLYQTSVFSGVYDFHILYDNLMYVGVKLLCMLYVEKTVDIIKNLNLSAIKQALG